MYRRDLYPLEPLFTRVYTQRPPRSAQQPMHPKGRIAVIGAGLTGISTAAHAIAHGFDVVIFEKSDKIGHDKPLIESSDHH